MTIADFHVVGVKLSLHMIVSKRNEMDSRRTFLNMMHMMSSDPKDVFSHREKAVCILQFITLLNFHLMSYSRGNTRHVWGRQ